MYIEVDVTANASSLTSQAGRQLRAHFSFEHPIWIYDVLRNLAADRSIVRAPHSDWFWSVEPDRRSAIRWRLI